jgi:hypothetical protein
MRARAILAPVFVLLLGACAITQNVSPVEPFDGKEICVIENPAVVQAAFLPTYQKKLEGKGYTVRVLPADAKVTDCPVTSTYTANWRWDLALYMAYADLRIFTNGKQAGQATYDSLSGGANLGKFIKADEKLGELVDQLFARVK